MLTGVGAEALITLAGTPPMVGASDTVLIGHRTEGLDAASAAGLVRLPSDLRRIDAPAVVRDAVAAGRQAAAWLAGRGTGVWLHLDLMCWTPSRSMR
ncbi:hypothetical protein QM806_17900 [Rhodococcus sp. IEGM 1351]|uniref:hypothetical protein n=1 Tax=Rhodococcus sp. IEGM 1351 TaxID=3047089 RepID=UPI0024B67202|nr:hypothetical protein [Rhodococcus sp. IEGM 1351]MDI9937288.1 hypothetical protein [Rhodococcus sp. IEGM 1351]